jgi:hypothetical protein
MIALPKAEKELRKAVQNFMAGSRQANTSSAENQISLRKIDNVKPCPTGDKVNTI